MLVISLCDKHPFSTYVFFKMLAAETVSTPQLVTVRSLSDGQMPQRELPQQIVGSRLDGCGGSWLV